MPESGRCHDIGERRSSPKVGRHSTLGEHKPGRIKPGRIKRAALSLQSLIFLGPVLPPICKSGFWEQPRLIRPRLYSSELLATVESRQSGRALYMCILFLFYFLGGLPASSPWTWSVTDVRDGGRCNNRGNTLEDWSLKKGQKTFTQFRYSWIHHPAGPCHSDKA